ncbi:OmpA family protein [Jannaschia sp. LMIT008]|uniref:OmpA family protein n=1 Tax=Jannaschia maritima TaxID=3032585 RepID=UPI0028116A6E|nr:OmpA family protein [Jannaschia sp. LMIT008]
MAHLKKTPLFAALGVTAILAGCVQAPPGEPNRTRQGAITGAIAGGLIGAATGEGSRRDEILAGAVIGGAAGAGIGQVLDRQAAELRRDLDGNIDVVNTGDSIRVNAPESILFATDSAAVRAPGQIRTIARSLLNYPNSRVQVVGHTDNTGSAAYNQDLSERRARAVAGIMYEEGVSPARVSAIGRGESDPIATNQTADGRAQNRRVEIVIVPNR